VVASRFEVYLVRLDPTEGREIRKTRPCLVISPDEMNRHIGTVIVAPMTTQGREYPTRPRPDSHRRQNAPGKAAGQNRRRHRAKSARAPERDIRPLIRP